MKRGVLAFIQGRQRQYRKYCTNLKSEVSKKYVEDMKCITEKKFDTFNKVEASLGSRALAILNKNYTDSGVELKQICCTLYTHKKNMLSAFGSECPKSKDTMEEYVGQQVTQDIEIICEDEEKTLTKTCPTLEKLSFSNVYDIDKNPNSAGLFLYLVATLGEPEGTTGSWSRT